MSSEWLVDGLLVGAIVGSTVTYFITTRDKRIVKRVRYWVDDLVLAQDLGKGVARKALAAVEASSEEVLANYNLAARYLLLSQVRSEKKVDPAVLAAEWFICLELGLDIHDAFQILYRAKWRDDLPRITREVLEQARREKKIDEMLPLIEDVFRSRAP